MNLWAVDTETLPFEEPQYALGNKTRITPFKHPELVLVTAYDGKQDHLWRRDTAEAELLRLLSVPDAHFVFHNVSFDFGVLDRFSPKIGDLLLDLAEQNRLHDTGIMELLLQIARGDVAKLRTPKLSVLASLRVGLRLEKDSGVRCTFDRYLDPQIPLPAGHDYYARQDAIATYKVFRSQFAEASQYASDLNGALLPHAPTRFGLLTEGVQVKGALSLSWLESFPLRVDQAEAIRLRNELSTEAKRLEEALILYGWAKRGPKTGRFHLSNKAITSVLASYSKEHDIVPDLTPTGKISLSDKFWNDHVPRIPSASLAAPEGVFSPRGRLQVWLRYLRVRKLKGTFLDMYSTSPVHYPSYYNLGARTGRLSCTRPNSQQIPKHRDGIRSIFVPMAGRLLIEADYKAAELVGLAQIYHLRYGGSLLGKQLNAGSDPHITTAKRVFGEAEFNKATAPEQAKLRQGAKALNFGVPGGLGYRKFVSYAKRTWGFACTPDEARSLIQAFRSSDPELYRYLNEGQDPKTRLETAARNLGISFSALITALDAWRDPDSEAWIPHVANSRLGMFVRGSYKLPIRLRPGFDPRFDLFRVSATVPTGRIRGRCSYTEAHNSPFQGLISDAFKLSLWALFRVHRLDRALFSPVAGIHDSILIDAEPDRAEQAKLTLEECMLSGLRAVCPDIKGEVDLIGPLERWGTSTTAFGLAK